ncbi:hypothetical protein, conserved [Eimeria tenella]|uniref:Uncharacterized protein n=1 Tax=Eimeria tenella TaxID=5802 RepID=U6KKN5_EIMTE|nr:hypothetical protein, conserved [Eimeria tenella]CDJ38626.1 hypothetical protein, conserved [Eimeria tenella]|eukprot:XP_013229438.1 hypothetical protein, conserved [Eimeria tenella]
MQALSNLLPAVTQMGGQLAAADEANGTVTLRYEGPNAVTVKYGLEMELNDKLPDAAGSVRIEAVEAAA